MTRRKPNYFLCLITRAGAGAAREMSFKVIDAMPRRLDVVS
jgi:hypothetical protein